MIFIETIAKELLPELTGKKLSTVCLSTSNPVYLIFTEDKPYPEIVIRLSESDNISHPHNILVELYKNLGDLVPEPLILTKHGSKFISIQKGLKGAPWFQVAGNISFKEQWNILRNRAIGSLDNLHSAVKSNNNWKPSCNPGNELRQCYKNCVNSETLLPEGTEALVNTLSKELDKLGNIAAYPQHGDFCINNLILEENKIHIIDFEDFGMTYMPLHDQFTLALSIYQLSPGQAQNSLAEEINLCIKDSLNRLNIDENYLPGFFIHHLLLRLGAWSENRLPYREWLLTILEKFISTPNSFLK